MSKLGINQREDDKRWAERIHEIKQEGAEKLIANMVYLPAVELAVIYQMALDGDSDCDLGSYVNAKVKRLVEQRAIPLCNAQAD